MLIAG